ncbi:MAG: thioesterase [candidate division KSB1 bacterium]|nr:thioesterase [candidate division KSB1 bacterium]MDZ7273931.1 thioesterase [candidate division KSB1 bacterium]MDZ7286087.1 thioesterase [candidate division KSB1 bacterium]MDZ7299119.1 thioesterase [candidate division KSB1 bacterium]MDZ7306666.1 thioesterase [candidate division KSB1 bacterium]
MSHVFRRGFRVRHYELDFFHHLNQAVFVQYMQEAAIEASTAAGYSPAWYRERGAGWVIRKLVIRYLQQVVYGDDLEITTWVSDMKRVTSHREYVLMRVRDDAVVARARVNWVYVDLNTGQPLRIPAEFQAAFQPANELAPLRVRIPHAAEIAGAHRYESRRRVQTYEVDTVQHVHHAVYLHWVEQAYFDALRAAGHPIEKVRTHDWMVLQGGHEIEYFEPAFDNDAIKIVSWLCHLGRVRGAWWHEIYNADTGRLLARDYSLGVFVDRRGKLTELPPEILADVVRGPVAAGVQSEAAVHIAG